jgi:MYXO-CTERM domain-containing protein
MTKMRSLCGAAFLAVATVLPASRCRASAIVQGAYYQLGDADPAAAPGALANNPTVDSFINHLDLTRFGSPHYAADVPARGPSGDKLSMQFANGGLGGPAILGFYGRSDSLAMVQQGYALEAWVKAGPANLNIATGNPAMSLIAYNGDPSTNGFGLVQDGTKYVVDVAGTLHALGSAEVGAWHHVAYVQSLGTSSYYYDGQLVGQSTTDPIPTSALGGFWIGGHGSATAPLDLFNGGVDEVRYQSFNPLAAGAIDPTAFLITPAVPEPSLTALAGFAALAALRRRCRKSASRMASSPLT